MRLYLGLLEKLPVAGDYFISVERTSQGNGTSRYKLIVTVE
jgi:hypothetical protein